MRIRTLRKQQGLSMTGLAIRSGIEPSMLSLIERGKRPSKPTARRLAKALGVEPHLLWPEYEALRDY